MSLSLLPNNTVTLPATGVGSSVSEIAGENAYLTFSGTAGQNITFSLSSLVTTSSAAVVTITQPNGAQLAMPYCSPSTPVCSTTLNNLPVTGTYNVVVSTMAYGPFPMSFTASVSQDAAATLTSGTPYNLSIPQIGQNALLTFTATAGQTFALEFANVVTTPANTSVAVSVIGPGAGGSTIANITVSTSGAPTINLTSVAAGTYTVLVHPAATSASMTVTLVTNNVTSLPVTGVGTSASAAAGENAYFTFAGTAGENITVSLSSIVTSSSAAVVSIYQPNGTLMAMPYCSPATPVCSTTLNNLPVTGTYSVTITTTPYGQFAMSFTATLSQAVSASLVAGTPYSLTLPQTGQNALLTFTATVGQTFALEFANVVTTPANTPVAVSVIGPGASGPTIANVAVSTSSAPTLNLTSLAAGSYTVLVHPAATSASMTVTLVSNNVTSLPVTGAGTSVSAAAGENAYFTFAGTAGENMTFSLSSIVTASPAAVVSIYQPNGTLMAMPYCSPATPVCSTTLNNLPATGTYSVTITTTPYGQFSMSFTATLSQAVMASLTSGTPYTLSLSQVGQNGLLSFTLAAAQALNLQITGVSTSPASTSVAITVYNAAGSAVGSGSTTTATTIAVASLPAGTYSVLIHPSALTASLTLKY
jgi:hypothetical protein